MKKILFLVAILALFVAVPAAAQVSQVSSQEVNITAVSGTGVFSTEIGSDGSWNIVVELMGDEPCILIYGFQSPSEDWSFPYDGYVGEITLVTVYSVQTGEMSGQVDFEMGQIGEGIFFETPSGGDPIITSDYIGGGNYFTFSRGGTFAEWDALEPPIDDPDSPLPLFGCDAGGHFSTGCSVSNSFGGCSQSCEAGTYACCNNATFYKVAKCKCYIYTTIQY